MLTVHLTLIIPMVDDECVPTRREGGQESAARDEIEEPYEDPSVPFPDTVANPRAVVV